MREYEEKKKISRYLYSKPSLAVLIILIMLLTKATWNVYGKYKESSKSLALSTRELKDLENKENDLTIKVEALETNRGIEAEIRDKYPVTKEGEYMVVIVDNASGSKNQNIQSKESLWQKFLDLFR